MDTGDVRLTRDLVAIVLMGLTTLLVIVTMVISLLLYRKVKITLNAATRVMEKSEEAVAIVTDQILSPVAKGFGIMALASKAYELIDQTFDRIFAKRKEMTNDEN